jgi:hypothetical protein
VKAIELYDVQKTWDGPTWFNLSGPTWIIRTRRRLFVSPLVLFNRVATFGEHWWGFGVLRINRRALFYVGHDGVSVCFVNFGHIGQ